MCWMCVYRGVGHNETMLAHFMQYLLISMLDALASYDQHYRLGFGVNSTAHENRNNHISTNTEKETQDMN